MNLWYNDYRVNCLYGGRNNTNNHTKQENISAACYCRLSKDDETESTSISIETQKEILKDFCKSNEFDIFNFYCDDGYSGTNFERPAFKEMMDDIANGKVNTVIVKDLSRFGRDQFGVCYYIEKYFPNNNIRFIAVSDNLDTAEKNLDTNMIFHFTNFFNQYYPAECSRKTKQAFKAKAIKGEFIGTYAPYGYRKSSQDKHILEIDENVASIVTEIFEMAAYSGYGYNKIAHILTERKVPTPTAYRENKAYCEWNLTTIRTILENQVYLGHTINGKKEKPTFKSKRVINTPESEWIKVENTHPCIVSSDLWENAHNRLKSRKRTCKNDNTNIFAGLVKCSECGKALVISNGGKKPSFSCSTYKTKGKEYCRIHYISYDDLYNIVFDDIQNKLKLVSQKENDFCEILLKKLKSNNKSKTTEKKIAEIQAKIKRLDSKINVLYDDRIDGTISKERFIELNTAYENEREALKSSLSELQAQLQKIEDTKNNVDQFITAIKKYCFGMQGLTAEILNSLIDKIIIDNKVKAKKGYTQQITIYYRFIGNV